MSRRLRIALVHHLGPGGALRAAGALAQGLQSQGHEVDVFALGQGSEGMVGASEALKPKLLLPFQEAPWPKPWPLLGPALRARWQADRLRRLQQAHEALAEAVLADGCDLAWVQHDRITQAPFVLAALKGRMPTAYQCHEALRRAHEAPLQGPGWWLPPSPAPSARQRYHEAWEARALAQAKALDAQLSRQADRLLANSRYSAEALLRAYGRPAGLVPMGVDLEAFSPLPSPREDALLVVGRLGPLKGQHLVVEALALLPEGDRPSLWLMGDSGGTAWYRQALEARCRELGLNLRITEDATEAQLLLAYHQARMVVAPMVLEPFGLVALEAQACGTPVVAIAEAGLREALEDGVGGLFVPREAEALAGAIQRLRARPEWAKQLGAQGRAWVEAHRGWAAGVAALEATFQGLLANKA